MKLALVSGIVLAILTTLILLLFIFYVPYSKGAMIILTVISIIGYLSSAIYFETYKLNKK